MLNNNCLLTKILTSYKNVLIKSYINYFQLNAALERGYRVLHLYRTLDYKRWWDYFFKNFVGKFAALKTQASGWPRENMTDEEKDAFIAENLMKGIELDPELMAFNPGLRYLAKLILNR